MYIKCKTTIPYADTERIIIHNYTCDYYNCALITEPQTTLIPVVLLEDQRKEMIRVWSRNSMEFDIS